MPGSRFTGCRRVNHQRIERQCIDDHQATNQVRMTGSQHQCQFPPKRMANDHRRFDVLGADVFRDGVNGRGEDLTLGVGNGRCTRKARQFNKMNAVVPA
ncbi:hypothetical protein D3C75_884460 [compost metagenome]